MNLIKVEQNWPSNRLRINYELHNVCNFKCWYCFPGSNEGTYRWPDLELVKKNIKHLIDYYKETLGKEYFDLNVLGGEPTLWPELGDFVKFLKDTYGDKVAIMVTTNGSRTLNWWKKNAQYFDKVLISHHLSEGKKEHVRDVADALYEAPVYVDVAVLMDPKNWDKGVDAIEYFKKSKHRWGIHSNEVIHDLINYTDDQKKYLKKYLKRMPNLLWLYKNLKHHDYSNKAVFDNGKKKRFRKNYLLINRLNHFEGWKCNIGIDNITIKFTGELSGSCTENLYDLSYKYNLYNTDFVKNFNPVLKPTTCKKQGCFCLHELNTTKWKIYEN